MSPFLSTIRSPQMRLAAVLLGCILASMNETGPVRPRGAWAQPPLQAADLRGRLLVRDKTSQNKFLPAIRGDGTEPLIAEGYCVVTLRDQSRWIRGSDDREAVFDGLRYQFADERSLRLFLRAADDYAPVLNGDCPVALAESGERRQGRLAWGVLHERRLYFFSSAENRRKFSDDAGRYDDADLYSGGECLVSRVDDDRLVVGNPAAVGRYDGIRYHFFSGHYRDRFYSSPSRYLPLLASTSERQPMRGARPVEAIRLGDRDHSSSMGASSGASDASAREGQSGDEEATARSPAPIAASTLAMGGYCPVTIRDQGRWVRGRIDQTALVDNLTFGFAGIEEKQAFRADPARYIPALGGACPVTFAKTRRRAPGSIYHAASLSDDGLLYLFATAAEKAEFRANPDPYARIDVAARGECLVTSQEQQVSAPGNPAIAAWHGGYRFFFADASKRAKFLASPQRYVPAEQ